jgi:hypothetical protein
MDESGAGEASVSQSKLEERGEGKTASLALLLFASLYSFSYYHIFEKLFILFLHGTNR